MENPQKEEVARSGPEPHKNRMSSVDLHHMKFEHLQPDKMRYNESNANDQASEHKESSRYAAFR